MFLFFFFKQNTAYARRISDWSSDVCSSDLVFERERILPYTPAQIWAVLADFENHRVWNPYVRIKAFQIDPVTLRYELRMDPQKPKFLEVAASLLAAYPERLLTIDVRPSFLLKFEDSYALSPAPGGTRSEEHTSELQSLMRNSYAVFCLKKTTKTDQTNN